jgi:hypothetical protein
MFPFFIQPECSMWIDDNSDMGVIWGYAGKRF